MPNNNIVFGVDLLPRTTEQYDLGNTTYKWNNIYAKKIYSDGLEVITSHALGYGQIAIDRETGTNAVTPNTTQLVSISSNEVFTFKTGNKWLTAAGTNSATAGSDILTIGHALSGVTAKDSYATNNVNRSENISFTVTDIQFDAAGHITASADNTRIIPVFGKSGSTHAIGVVPDPGITEGTTKFLCEDATWKIPSVTIPVATTTALGGIQVGYTTNNKNYQVQLDNEHNAYVNVPWENTWNALTTTVSGYVSAPNFQNNENGELYFLRGDISWATLPAATTSSAGIIQIGTSSTNAAAGNHIHGNISNTGTISIINNNDTGSMAVVTDSDSAITIANLSVGINDATDTGNTTTTFVSSVTQNSIGKITVSLSSMPDFLTTAGGIMSGGLSFQEPTINLTSNTNGIEVDKYFPMIKFIDGNATPYTAATLRARAETDGDTSVELLACNTLATISEGATVYNETTAGIRIRIGKDGHGQIFTDSNIIIDRPYEQNRSVGIGVQNSTIGLYTGVYLGTDGVSHGLYSNGYSADNNANSFVSDGKWLIYRDTSGNINLREHIVNYRIRIKNEDRAKGYYTPDGATTFGYIGFYDKNENILGQIYNNTTSANIIRTNIFAYKNSATATSGDYAYFGPAYNTSSDIKRTYTNCLVYGAVWNDYAEYRKGEVTEGGYCVTETPSGMLMKTTKRLQAGCRITSDTFGFAIGETKECQTPIAVSGRVLVYPYRPKEEYLLGDALCSAPNGTVDIMTREEIREYPERIVGIVSEIPNYETWYGGGIGEEEGDTATPVPVNGRIWIYVR